MSTTSKDTPAFPAHPELEKQPWVKSLSASERANYEKIRQDGVDRDVKILVKVIRDYPGFGSVSDEEVEHLARRWAINLADAWDEGGQSAMSYESPELQQLRSYKFASQDAYVGG